jgi:Dimerisation domain
MKDYPGSIAAGHIDDRLIASPRVQRWALANPVTRPVARRRARAMLDLCAGFVYSQVLFTCVRLRLFDILFKEPLTTAALAERLSLSPEATCRLLDAAVSLGLAERRGRSVYGLGQLGAALAGNRAALSLIEHQPLLYADLQDPVALLRGSPRGTGIARYWPVDRIRVEHLLRNERLRCGHERVAKEFSSPRRQRGRRPYASCFSICPLWSSGLVPGSLMPDFWSELRSMEAIS